ncbi:exported hypothetical protein [Rhodococcus sp. RD6.2]|jgi:hypothetical protein|uniref:hypothetical protein n=1 Tax=Rhodococcus sp. RD6.2 TaxID=260936 RepID=UPI00063B658B|nr:hypothetical protein [Rhodococcus sp. RD6.2]CRK53596.1 exported hypothetical protein [Rhodococcus sp. RD6.2]
MSSGIGRRLAGCVAVAAALAGSMAVGTGTAAAQYLIEPIPIFGSLDAGSQIPDGDIGLGEAADVYFIWIACYGVTGSVVLTSSDIPDSVTERCSVRPTGPGWG